MKYAPSFQGLVLQKYQESSPSTGGIEKQFENTSKSKTNIQREKICVIQCKLTIYEIANCTRDFLFIWDWFNRARGWIRVWNWFRNWSFGYWD
jgi:hypothetical protein